jgi:hypothetical protein
MSIFLHHSVKIKPAGRGLVGKCRPGSKALDIPSFIYSNILLNNLRGQIPC